MRFPISLITVLVAAAVFTVPAAGAAVQAQPGAKAAYKAYPFKISGVRQPFAVKVSWFTKAPGSGGSFRLAAGSFLRAHT